MKNFAYPITKKANDISREKIQADIRAFKRAGGKVTRVPTGLSGDPSSLTRKQRDFLRRTLA